LRQPPVGTLDSLAVGVCTNCQARDVWVVLAMDGVETGAGTAAKCGNCWLGVGRNSEERVDPLHTQLAAAAQDYLSAKVQAWMAEAEVAGQASQNGGGGAGGKGAVAKDDGSSATEAGAGDDGGGGEGKKESGGEDNASSAAEAGAARQAGKDGVRGARKKGEDGKDDGSLASPTRGKKEPWRDKDKGKAGEASEDMECDDVGMGGKSPTASPAKKKSASSPIQQAPVQRPRGLDF